MQDAPSPQLVDLLAQLQLAGPEQVRRVRRWAKRLARGTALVDWVWVDALVQARVLTPYQGVEINAGRGERMSLGAYLLERRTGQFGYADSFIALDRASKTKVQLLVARQGELAESDVQRVRNLLASLVAQAAGVETEAGAKLLAADCDERAVWVAYAPARGICAAQWLACQGRFSPRAALEIARQLAASLAKLEAAGIVHGDVSASAVQIAANGAVQIGRAGIRGIVRPDETLCAEELPIEALDYLAPERISQRTAANTASDVYGFGCLCWHLLAGRTPMAGGNVAAKLAAVRSPKIPDLRRLAPDADDALLNLVQRCLQIDSAARPESFAAIADALGEPTASGQRWVADAMARSRRSTVRPTWQWQVRTKLQRSATQLSAAAACSFLLLMATWPLWRSPRSTAHPLATVPLAASAATSAALNSPLQPGKVAGDVASPLNSTAVDNAKRALAAGGGLPVNAANVAGTVQLVNYQAKDQPRRVMELPAGADVQGVSLRFEAGATVRGSESQRLRILAPPNGVVVAVEDVRFENVDFIWRNPPQRITTPDQMAVVDQRACRAEFVGCTFQAEEAAPFGLPVAIRLRAAGAKSATLAPACRVRLEQCTIGDVAAVVEGASPGPMAIEFNNSLQISRGPLIRLNEPPAIDAPVAIVLKHLTARGASSVLELAGGRSTRLPGAISIEAVACVFALQPTGALVTFTGAELPKATASGRMAIDWTGQGSLSEVDTVVANWHHEGTIETLADDLIAVEGLVTGKLEFAGTAASDPAASRLLYWLAPLFSDDSPGIGETLPTLRR